ncbi:hypothetical protein CR513_33488, partial [Mucuna pruriens]
MQDESKKRKGNKSKKVPRQNAIQGCKIKSQNQKRLGLKEASWPRRSYPGQTSSFSTEPNFKPKSSIASHTLHTSHALASFLDGAWCFSTTSRRSKRCRSRVWEARVIQTPLFPLSTEFESSLTPSESNSTQFESYLTPSESSPTLSESSVSVRDRSQLKLPILAHPKPYKLQLLNNEREIIVAK